MDLSGSIQVRKLDTEPVRLCRDFDEYCFAMTKQQHEMCAKSLPMYCSMTGEYVGEFEAKSGHCPFVGE
jgi:hypothetical protein